MTLHVGQRGQAPGAPPSALHRVCFGLLIVNVAYLAALLFERSWIVDASGRPIHTDFTSVYAAGKLVRDGHPAAAYDWNLHYAAENAVVAHDPSAYLGWHYPPPLLMVAALLAALPYASAFIVWVAATLPLYLVTIRAIVGSRFGWLLAGAVPCLMPNVVPGQNGLLTASLIGATLALLEAHPLLAGCCLGLLTYKPQFGILFPLVLAGGGYWRAIGAAAVSAAVLALATVGLFGATPWTEFVHWLPLTSQALLSENHTAWAEHIEWNKFQSLFALVRLWGGGATLAWTLQGVLTVAVAVVICAMWWSPRTTFDLKAAATAVGVVLATPYVYLYDLTILAVAVAFVVRRALIDGFLPGEVGGLIVVMALWLVLPFLGMPVGLLIAAMVALLIVRRTRNALAGAPLTPPERRVEPARAEQG